MFLLTNWKLPNCQDGKTANKLLVSSGIRGLRRMMLRLRYHIMGYVAIYTSVNYPNGTTICTGIQVSMAYT